MYFSPLNGYTIFICCLNFHCRDGRLPYPRGKKSKVLSERRRERDGTEERGRGLLTVKFADKRRTRVRHGRFFFSSLLRMTDSRPPVRRSESGVRIGFHCVRFPSRRPARIEVDSHVARRRSSQTRAPLDRLRN